MKTLKIAFLGGLLIACGPPDPRVIYTDGVDFGDSDDDADDDTGDDDAAQPTSYTLACTARAIPNATTARVRLRSNFATDQAWLPTDADTTTGWATGTTLTWTGALDAARLADDPCPHGCTTCGMCGYVLNVERDGTPAEPRYLLQGLGTGVQQYVDCTLDGPTSVPLTVDSASSNNNGRNFHLNGS